MCTNALNCTHSPLIDGAVLLRSTGQILQKSETWAVSIHQSIGDLLISRHRFVYTLIVMQM